ncbi:MAG: transposase [Steroidobacteraceae bacterium]
MGASAGVVMTDRLGRRSGPRRQYSVAEKRSMVEETHVAGASVPEVALRHSLNANLLSVWRRLYAQGRLIEDTAPRQPALLPVKVSTPTLLPSERVVTRKPAAKPPGVWIEVEFAGGQRLRIQGRVDRAMLKDLILALSSR